MAEVAGDRDDRVAGDPGEDRHRERRCVQHAVLHDEDVLARPVGDIAVVREHDRFVVAASARLHRREHRVEVDPRRLRDVRDDVRADALPARDLRGDALRLAVLTEIRAPREADDHDVDRVSHGRHAELAVAVERKRPEVAGRDPVDRDDLARCDAELLDRVREIHVEDPRRVLESHEMLVEAEDRRPLLRVVAADALEYAGAVVEPVRRDVDLRVRPVDELSVHPDLLGRLHRARSPLFRRIVGSIRDDVHRPDARQPAQVRRADAQDVLCDPAPAQTI